MSIYYGTGTYGQLKILGCNIDPEDPIYVGKYCSIADQAAICVGRIQHRYTTASSYPFHELHNVNCKPNAFAKRASRIGNDVWIGDSALILDGVTIHNGAVIGRRSVVTKDVPPYAIVAGNPARVVKYRFDPETIERLNASNWWDIPHDYIIEHIAPHVDDINTFLSKVQEYYYQNRD